MKLLGNFPLSVKKQICKEIYHLYQNFRFLLDSDALNEADRLEFTSVNKNMDLVDAADALYSLCGWLYAYYGKKVIVLIDEYDTPMQEAWLNGYWNEIASLFRSMFKSTFKTNPYLERGIMTGITRISVVDCNQSAAGTRTPSWAILTADLPAAASSGVRSSKESIFSDLNNLKVITTTSSQYGNCFGFTEKDDDIPKLLGVVKELREKDCVAPMINSGNRKIVIKTGTMTNTI